MGGASRGAAALVAAVLLGSLAACGGDDDPYCRTIEADQPTLDDFGSTRSNDAYTKYAATLSSISKVAPADAKQQWTALAAATRGVVEAHEQVGFPLEDMRDADKRQALSESDAAVLEEAYSVFNDTTDARQAVVDEVQDACDIDLK